MRWEELFADVGGQWGGRERRDLELEVADRIRGERARVRLVDRLRAAEGAVVAVHVGDGEPVRGAVVDCAPEWVLLAAVAEPWTGHASGRRILVPMRHVVVVRGLPRHSRGSSSLVAERRGLTSALRALAVTRCPVQLRTRAATGVGVVLHGTVENVGADHLDLVEHGTDQLPGRRAPVTVSLDAVVAVVDATGEWAV